MLVAFLVYGALTLVGHRALLPHVGSHVYDQNLPGNDCLLHVWALAWDQHALVTDPAHVCDANIFFPYDGTLLYSDHLLGLAVPTAPFRLVVDNPVLIHNALTVAAPALDALALRALALELGATPVGALAGGVLYGFAPIRFVAERCQIQMLAAWWLPLVLLLAHRALTTGSVRAGALAGAALALQGFTGIYLTAFLLPVLAVAQCVWLRRSTAGARWRGATALVLAEAAAGLALLPMSLAYRRVQLGLGASRSTALNALLSLVPTTIPTHLPAFTLSALATLGLLAPGVTPAFRLERRLLGVMVAGTFVLALGPSIALPGGLGQVRGPYAALLALPGFDALRAPARFVHLMLLAGSLLAAGGLDALRAALPRAAGIVAAVVLAGAVVECWTPAQALTPARPPRTTDPVYAWLAEQPETVHIMEYPLDDYAISAARYQYASIGHWKKTSVGTMGIMPPLYPWLAHAMGDFPAARVRTALRDLGLTHVVAHLPGPARTALLAAAADPAAGLTVVHESALSVVAAVGDVPPHANVPSGRALGRAGWRVSASHAAALAPLAVDDDPATSWNSWGDLEDAASRWRDPVPFFERWKTFLAGQPAHFDVDLGAPARVTGVTVRLGGSDPMAAPNVVVEGSLDGAAWTPLPGTLDPTPDARSLVMHAADARFALVCRAPVDARFIRLSCNGYEWRIGDLQVHAE